MQAPANLRPFTTVTAYGTVDVRKVRLATDKFAAVKQAMDECRLIQPDSITVISPDGSKDIARRV